MNASVYYKGDPPTGCHARRSIIYPPEATPSRTGKSNRVLPIAPAPPHRLPSQRWHGNHRGGPPYTMSGGVVA